MKNTIKSSILAGIATLISSCTNAVSLPDITKPYLGEYECKIAQYNGEDYLEQFDFIRLTLSHDDDFTLAFRQKDGEIREEKGKYVYQAEKEEITLYAPKAQALKRTFPLKDGEITVTLRFGNQTLHMQFQQK